MTRGNSKAADAGQTDGTRRAEVLGGRIGITVSPENEVLNPGVIHS